jgi:hypothetical protein
MPLSLLGCDPLENYETLFLTARGRRVNAVSPAEKSALPMASGGMK